MVRAVCLASPPAGVMRIDVFNQLGDAQQVRHQNPLLPAFVARVANFGHKFDRCPPIALRRANFAHRQM
jgi:hypothetical protein